MKNGQPQRSDARLFMQFLAFGGCADATPLADHLSRAKIAGVLYEDVNDPRGIGLLTFSAGLAVVLMAIGMAVLFAKHLLPDSKKTANSAAFRYLR